jgi:hypothetical protein
MKVTPKSEKEIQEANLINPGIYQFEVITVSDKPSKSGNEMITVQLKIWDISGAERFVYDYLLDAMAYKIRHFAEVTGLIDKYNSGEILSSDCLHKTGYVEIVIQEGKGSFAARNSVKDYIKKGENSQQTVLNPEPFNDDIPF